MEQQVVQIRQNLKVAQDRHKIYVDKNRTPKEFKLGDHVYLWTSPKISSLRMGTCDKMEPHFCGPFEIL
jgi:hypothetical protein